MLGDFNCPAIDTKEARGEKISFSKNLHYFLRFVYIELEIIFAIPTDTFVHLVTILTFIRVGNKQ